MSSDLTHTHIVKEGDTLQALCKNIYGDSSKYLGVAKANNLENFRNLQPGIQLFFPPIVDSSPEQ